MKHYRILEKKQHQKEYIIQYLKPTFFGLQVWKKIQYHNPSGDRTIYHKYDEALTEIKSLIKQEDYDTLEFGYHYIDAYKLFKAKSK